MLRNITIVLLVLALIGVASGAILQTYGTISGTYNIEQAVVFSDDKISKTYDFGDITNGTTEHKTLILKNRADASATVELDTTTNPHDNITIEPESMETTIDPESTKDVSVGVSFNSNFSEDEYSITTEIAPVEGD